MEETMMEALRRRRGIAAVRSMSASEANEEQLHNKAEAVKEQLGNTNGINADKEYINQLSHHYYAMLARYRGSRINTKVVDSLRRQQLWGRVQTCCKQAEVSPERYMKAQFNYFHTAFGTAPKLSQLATEAAVERASAFEGKTEGKVVASAQDAKVNLGAVFSRCEQQVRDICRAQKVTREEYYQRFVLTNLISMPIEFLKADPVYRRVADGSNSISEAESS
jgi:hypothetical protein